MSKKHKRTEGENHSIPADIVFVTTSDTWILPRSDNQRDFVQKVREKDLVVAIGPAGVGKTFLAVAMALQALKEEKIERIILTRPVVTTRLGTLRVSFTLPSASFTTISRCPFVLVLEVNIFYIP